MLQLRTPPSARIELLIRCQPEAAFAAFVEPSTLCEFWLASASGPLGPDARVRWSFLVRGASAELRVQAWEPSQRLLTLWDDGTSVEWRFAPHVDGTVVTITQTGFSGDADQKVASALDATSGFTLVLCELKARLEGRGSLGAVRDKAALLEARATSA